ncbi:MAG: CPBP family intramembrane metalloprotease [Planctomycetes bacterium]|nr:CPBP family intramembrane metalloprotease [Planctomycetota bacterium]MBI3834244.1 CPBP family intramembrane metalloprotease [Planctomycetota bacterium]
MDEESSDNPDRPPAQSPPSIGGEACSIEIEGEIPWARAIGVAPPDHLPTLEPIKLFNETKKQAWIDILILALLWAAFEISVGTVAHHVAAWKLGITDDTELNHAQVEKVMLVPVILIRAVGFAFFIGLLLRHRGQTWAAVGIRIARLWINILVGLAGTCIAYAVHFLLLVLIFAFFPKLLEGLEQNADRLKDMLPPVSLWIMVPFMSVVGSYEELVFRGFLLPRLRRGTGSWILAVIISTAMFTLPHAQDQTVAALIPIAGLSLTLSVMTIWRRSIVPGIVTHFLFNATQLIGLYWQTHAKS